MVLRVQAWINELMEAPCVSGFLIRTEFRKALRALVEFSTTGKYQFSTVDTEIEGEEVAIPVNDDGSLVALENPFLNPAAALVSEKGGFILLGHPGIGKNSFPYL
jgi:hypothetical protein